MRNVSLKRMEVKCFAAQDVLGRKLLLWCCRETLLQEEERIRENENGQTKCWDVGCQDLEISSDGGKVNRAGQGWVSFPESQSNWKRKSAPI